MNSYPGPYGQVMTNLFLNSVMHAFPDRKGGEIDIRLVRAAADHVEILFSDDGCGMSLEVRRQALDPFFTTRRDGGRIGLGLHIVHNIVVVASADNCISKARRGRVKESGSRCRAPRPGTRPRSDRKSCAGRHCCCYFSCSMVTATAAFADRRTLLPSTSATRLLSMK